MTRSCIYVGSLRHRRFAPRVHEFDYPLFMMYLDLEELPELFDGRLLWSAKRPAPARYRRSDHLGPSDKDLARCVRELVESRIGRRPRGPIRLLTHLRYLGYGFNPVSFYYCFDQDDEVEAVVAEINNTPWGEQYCYVVDGLRDDAIDKAFHVSPFLTMEQRYQWGFSAPGEHLSVHMENHTDSGKIFDATLNMEREAITTASLNRILVRFPVMTAKVVTRIYWQAALLWWKKCPISPHPKLDTSTEGLKPR